MITLPISICLFTSTKGHFGIKTMYLDTVNHLNQQIPLSQFGARYAHIKVGLSQEDQLIAADITTELENRGFHVDRTPGDWSRGTSHQQAYLSDMAKASRSPVVLSQPYMLLLEDDSTLSPHKDNLLFYLSRMSKFLEKNNDIVSTRLVRRCDFDGGIPMKNTQYDHFFSPNFDFQPAILRSRDYFLANKVIQDNWAQLSHLQCELVMRMALDTLSTSSNNHVVMHPDYIETHHLGTPDYNKTRTMLGLA